MDALVSSSVSLQTNNLKIFVDCILSKGKETDLLIKYTFLFILT